MVVYGPASCPKYSMARVVDETISPSLWMTTTRSFTWVPGIASLNAAVDVKSIADSQRQWAVPPGAFAVTIEHLGGDRRRISSKEP